MRTISPTFGTMAFAFRPQATTQQTFTKEDYLSMFSPEGQRMIQANWDAYQRIMETPGDLQQAVRQYQRLRSHSTHIEDFVAAIARVEDLDSRFRPNGQFFICMLMDWLIQRQEPPTGGQVELVLREVPVRALQSGRRLLSN